MSLISYGKQYLDSKDIKSVNKILYSSFLTQGPTIQIFEKKLKSELGAKFCTAVSNGTAALHLLGLALKWKKGDIIISTPNSFVATSNCILYSGARPSFVDIDYKTGNICIKSLKKKIKILKKKKKKIKAIIAIDYGGCPADWPELQKISKKDKIILINDGCHSLGASINKNYKYAAKFADFVTYSFHPVKSITTGEGGAIVSNNKKVDQQLKNLRTHGIEKNSNNIWMYDMKRLGFNYRITDFQCALGISQLKKLKKFIKKRTELAKIYDKAFIDDKDITIQLIDPYKSSSYHLYPIKINFKKLNFNKNNFFKKLLKFGIKLQVHYIPIYKHTFYKKKFNLKEKNFPHTEKFYNEVISLPIFFDLSKKKQLYIISKIKNIISKNIIV